MLCSSTAKHGQQANGVRQHYHVLVSGSITDDVHIHCYSWATNTWCAPALPCVCCRVDGRWRAPACASPVRWSGVCSIDSPRNKNAEAISSMPIAVHIYVFVGLCCSTCPRSCSSNVAEATGYMQGCSLCIWNVRCQRLLWHGMSSWNMVMSSSSKMLAFVSCVVDAPADLIHSSYNPNIRCLGLASLEFILGIWEIVCFPHWRTTAPSKSMSFLQHHNTLQILKTMFIST